MDELLIKAIIQIKLFCKAFIISQVLLYDIYVNIYYKIYIFHQIIRRKVLLVFSFKYEKVEI